MTDDVCIFATKAANHRLMAEHWTQQLAMHLAVAGARSTAPNVMLRNMLEDDLRTLIGQHEAKSAYADGGWPCCAACQRKTGDD